MNESLSKPIKARPMQSVTYCVVSYTELPSKIRAISMHIKNNVIPAGRLCVSMWLMVSPGWIIAVNGGAVGGFFLVGRRRRGIVTLIHS